MNCKVCGEKTHKQFCSDRCRAKDYYASGRYDTAGEDVQMRNKFLKAKRAGQ